MVLYCHGSIARLTSCFWFIRGKRNLVCNCRVCHLRVAHGDHPDYVIELVRRQNALISSKRTWSLWRRSIGDVRQMHAHALIQVLKVEYVNKTYNKHVKDISYSPWNYCIQSLSTSLKSQHTIATSQFFGKALTPLIFPVFYCMVSLQYILSLKASVGSQTWRNIWIGDMNSLLTRY